MSEEVMLSGRVPEELKELVDADRRDNQEVLRAALWREFGGERKSDIERRIEEKQNRVSMIERERNERDRELQREREELEALKSKLQTVEDSVDSRRSAFDGLLDDMEADGVHVWPGCEPVSELAREHGESPADIVDSMKQLAAEQERDIRHTQFKRADAARGERGRPIAEVYDSE